MVKLGKWQYNHTKTLDLIQFIFLCLKPTDLHLMLTFVSHQELHRKAGVRTACCENRRETAEGVKASDTRRTHTASHPGELLLTGH